VDGVAGLGTVAERAANRRRRALFVGCDQRSDREATYCAHAYHRNGGAYAAVGASIALAAANGMS